MCRILALRADEPVDMAPWLLAFRAVCRASPEYQGHGWGVAWREGEAWQRHRSVTPIWEDPFTPPPTRLAVVHARSAFRNEGVVVENNMPFLGDQSVFAFNGEIHGVRLRVPGGTGAARLHRLVDRFVERAQGDQVGALRRLDEVVRARSAHVRGMNIVTSDGHDLFALCRYGQDDDYFTLRRATFAHGGQAVASEPLSVPGVTTSWHSLDNGSTHRLGGSGV